MDADATRAGKCRPHASVLPTESELRNQCPVPLDVVAPEIIQQPTTTTHEHQQATTAVMVLLVELQMLRQVVNTPREERNLHLRRTGIGPMEAMLSDCCSGIGHAKTKILRVAEAGTVPRTPRSRRVGVAARGDDPFEGGEGCRRRAPCAGSPGGLHISRSSAPHTPPRHSSHDSESRPIRPRADHPRKPGWDRMWAILDSCPAGIGFKPHHAAVTRDNHPVEHR